MADDRGRLGASDLNRCLVDALYEEDGVRLYYPKPIFEGFNSVLGDKDIILTEGEQAWDKASRDYEWAQKWQAILDRFAKEIPYTLEQLELIESRIKQGNQEQFYTNLKNQKLNKDDEEELEILKEDIKSACLGFEEFSSLFDPVATIANSSYQLIENRLIIIHATVDTTKEITPEISAGLIIEKLKRQRVVLDEVEITHLIPEVGKGRLDGLFGVNHIRLRIAQGDPIDMPGSQLIDPRDLYQGTFDTVNCGRYVATMIGQAVGLYKENRQITVEALRASPIVKNAAKFTSAEALQAATKFASEYPVDVELQQNEVERIIEQIRQLNYTYQQRVTLGAEYNHFWGSFFGAYSATQKQNISQKILDGADLNAADQKIAEQGDLGNLYRQLEEARKKDNSPSDEESLKSNFG